MTTIPDQEEEKHLFSSSEIEAGKTLYKSLLALKEVKWKSFFIFSSLI